jgi:DNA modification methylase
VTLWQGDCLEVLRELPARSVDMIATSPPFYGLRDYGTGTWEGGETIDCPDCETREEQLHCKTCLGTGELGCDHLHATGGTGSSTLGAVSGGNDMSDAARERSTTRSFVAYKDVCGKCGARRVDRQVGLEETPEQWVENLVAVFRECRRVLTEHGTLWVEIGDSYAHANLTRRTPEELAREQERDADKDYDDSYVRRARNSMGVPDGMKQKDLLGQPWLLAFALRADGWYLRSEIIWSRPNPMPESVTDRPTKAHSTVFLLSKQPRYFYDADAIRDPHQYDGRKVTHVEQGSGSIQHRNGERWPGEGANARSVWTIPTESTPFAHFATWPQALVRKMVMAGTSEVGICPECRAPWVRQVEAEGGSIGRDWNQRRDGGKDDLAKGHSARRETVDGTYRRRYMGWQPSCAHSHTPVPAVVLDPFAGSGTTLLVARQLGRHAIGIELNPEYCKLAGNERLAQQSLLTEILA